MFANIQGKGMEENKRERKKERKLSGTINEGLSEDRCGRIVCQGCLLSSNKLKERTLFYFKFLVSG